MGKSAPSQPAPIIVDAGKSASSQATFNKEAGLQQRALNMVDQYTPQGSTTYSPTGTETEGIPGMKVTQTLSPEQQRLYDMSTRLSQQYGDIGESQLGKVAGSLSDPFSTASLGDAPQINEATRSSTLANMMARQQPQMDRDRAALETQLANQGFMAGTEGYKSAMDERNRAMNDMYLGADIGAGAEMANMYGLESTARDKAINEMLMQRNQPMSELSALMSGSQPTSPQFLSTPQGNISAPDFMDAQYGSANMQNAANQNAFNQRTGMYNANLEGLYGLAGAGAGAAGGTYGGSGWTFSDRRLKRNIERIGKLANGLAVYTYNYIWGGVAQIGLMADEVKAIHPHAVKRFGGFDAVNYAEAVK